MNLDTSIHFNDWLFLLQGAGVTLLLCFSSMFFGIFIGFLFGLMRASKNSVLNYISGAYVYIIRGTPLLMQLFLVFYGMPLLLGINIPPYITALTGLSLYAGAYLTEIVKAGLLSVDMGQKEAAKALGLNFWQEFRYVVFPQALKVIIPPALGFFIALIKDSSLVSIIGYIELTRSSRLVIARTFQPFTIYFGAAAIYFVICYGLSAISRHCFEGRLSN